MAAAASFRSVTSQMNETTSHKLLYRYLTDEMLYELLWRIQKPTLNNDIQTAITNSNDASLHGVIVNTSIGGNSRNNDIYIIIKIAQNNRNIGHITLHLIPSDTRATTLGPLHIRNNTYNIRVSRIKVTLHENPVRVELSRGSAPDGYYGIGNTLLARVSDIILGVFNAYLDELSPKSLRIPSLQVNYTNTRIRSLVRNITRPLDARQHEPRIRRTRFSNNHGIRGGALKRRKTQRKKRNTKI